MRLSRRPARIDHLYAVGFAGGDGEVGASNTSEKGPAFLLEAVLVFVRAAALVLTIAAAGARHAETDFIVEKDRQVRLQIAAEDFVQEQDGFAAQFSSSTLVGLGRVSEAVAEHDPSLGERGQNHLVNMLSAGGEHESHLSQWSEPGSRRVQQHFADLFAGGGAAWFACDGDGDAVGAQGSRQFLDLRALAAAIEAFERNKLSAWGHAGNDSRAAGVPCMSSRGQLDWYIHGAAISKSSWSGEQIREGE